MRESEDAAEASSSEESTQAYKAVGQVKRVTARSGRWWWCGWDRVCSLGREGVGLGTGTIGLASNVLVEG